MNCRIKLIPDPRPAPYLHRVLVMFGKVFVRGRKPELPEDMAHDWPRHHYLEIVPKRQPVPDQGLDITLVLSPRYDIVKVEPVLIHHLQPSGEEIF